VQNSANTRVAVPVVAAVGANLAVLAVGKAADASFVVAGRNDGDAPMEIGVAAVIIASVLPLVIGLVATALAARRWPRAAGRLRIAGAALAVLSLAAPLTADTDTTTRLSLAVMHLVVGAAYLAGTRRTAASGVTAEAATAQAVGSSR
jgi:hypothetical protein